MAEGLTIKLPTQVEYILNKLMDAGFEAYIVGGCVRDKILGNTPNDWDICTNAKPDAIKEVFKNHKTIDTGIKHGTVTLVCRTANPSCTQTYEITTYRTEGQYSDHRHPDSVNFVSDLIEDLSRRDFTINAMAYNPQEGLIDPFNGFQDLEKWVIRCVGDPSRRFEEDALRIIRAIRFSLRYRFEISTRTRLAMEKHMKLLKSISKERISDELAKIFLYSEFPITVNTYENLMLLCDAIELVIENYPNERNIAQINRILSRCNRTLDERLAIFFNSYHIADDLTKLRFSKDIVKSSAAMRNHAYSLLQEAPCDPTVKANKAYVRSFLLSAGEDVAFGAVNIVSCTIMDEASTAYFDSFRDILYEMIYSQEDYNLYNLVINGDDLKELGYKGSQIGKILNRLQKQWVLGNVENRRKELLDAIERDRLYL